MNDLTFLNGAKLSLSDMDSFLSIEFKADWFYMFEDSINELLLFHKLEQKPKGQFVISYCKKILSLIDENKTILRYEFNPINPRNSDACDLTNVYQCKIDFPKIILFNRFLYGILEQFSSKNQSNDKKTGIMAQVFISSVFSLFSKNKTVLCDVVNWFNEPLKENVFKGYKAKMKDIDDAITLEYMIDDDEKIYHLPMVLKTISEKISA